MKKCTRCEQEFPATFEYFNRANHIKSGLTPRCKACCILSKKESRERRPPSPETRRQYVRTYKERHPDRVKAQERRQNLLRKFNMTVAEYEVMFAEQEGKCAICGCESEGKLLAVDHCHLTNKVRGLLCTNCNTALGLMKDSIERLQAAISYLA